MILEQNYLKVTEYTQKAIKLYYRRALAQAVLTLMHKKSLKGDYEWSSNISSFRRQQSISEDRDSNTQSNPLTEQLYDPAVKTSVQHKVSQEQKSEVQISVVRDGDCVHIQSIFNKIPIKIYSALDQLKVFSPSDLPQSSVNRLRCCFLIVSPCRGLAKGSIIRKSDIVCFQSVFTKKFLSVTQKHPFCVEFLYETQLSDTITQSCLFQLRRSDGEKGDVHTNEQLLISLFHQTDISLTIHADRHEKSLYGSFRPIEFKLRKVHNIDEFDKNHYYYIKNLEAHAYLQFKELDGNSLFARQTYANIGSEDENGQTTKISLTVMKVVELKKHIEQPCKLRSEIEPKGCLQCVWEVQPQVNGKVNEFKLIHLMSWFGVFVKNRQLKLTSNEDQFQNFGMTQLSSDHVLTYHDSVIFAQYNKVEANYQFAVRPQGAHYESEKQQTYFKFQELPPKTSLVIRELNEVSHCLRDVLVSFEDWGLEASQNDTVKFTVEKIRTDAPYLRRQKAQLKAILSRLELLALQEDRIQPETFKYMTKQLKIFEMLIILCKNLTNKIIETKTAYTSKCQTPFSLSRNKLESLLKDIFGTIYVLIVNSQPCSSLVIREAAFFNGQLLHFPEEVGMMLQEAIKNLSFFNTHVSENEYEEFFQWAKMIEPITEKTVTIQKKCIDILAKVVVDPEDKGITLYQRKCKEIIFPKARKGALPKFGVQDKIRTQSNLAKREKQPLIIFETTFGREQFLDKNPFFRMLSCSQHRASAFYLKNFFEKNDPRSESYIEYIKSLIRLLRNLCKDGKKKLLGVVEDWGLTAEHINAVFTSSQIHWQLKMEYLSLYSCVHIDQEPFLPFDKRETKCHIWSEIPNYNLTDKIALTFKQYTDKIQAETKLRIFDSVVPNVIKGFFSWIEGLEELNLTELKCFLKLTSVIYDSTNFGLLKPAQIKYYIYQIVTRVNKLRVSKSTPLIKPVLLRLYSRICDILELYERIWVDLNGIKVLCDFKTNYETRQNYAKTAQVELKCINMLLNNVQLNSPIIKRRGHPRSYQQRSSHQLIADDQLSYKELDEIILQFLLTQLYRQNNFFKKAFYQKIVKLLSLRKDKHLEISRFLRSLMLINSEAEEIIYQTFSGRPAGQLMNMLNVQELVQKIQSWEADEKFGDEQIKQKREKILELNNLLSRNNRELQKYKSLNLQLYRKCQTILERLGAHQILLAFIPHSHKHGYYELTLTLHEFYLEFIEQNPHNTKMVAAHFRDFVAYFKFPKLPELLAKLYVQLPDKRSSFAVLYEILERSDSSCQEYVWETIHRILSELREDSEVRMDVVTLIMKEPDLRSMFFHNNQGISRQFINVLCQVADQSLLLISKVHRIFRKSDLLLEMASDSGYDFKAAYLKIYQTLYFCRIDIDLQEIIFLLQEVVLPEFKQLPYLYHAILIQESSKVPMEDLLSLSHLSEDKRVLPTNEEKYWNYMLDFEDPTAVSLVNLTVTLTKGLKKINAKPPIQLVQFCQKLVNVQQLISSLGRMNYYSHIMVKFEQLVELFWEFNRPENDRNLAPPPNQRSTIASFFQNLAEVIVRQRISPQELFECLGTSRQALNSLRILKEPYRVDSMPSNCNLITESQFLRYMGRIQKIVENQRFFNEKLSNSFMIQFFRSFCRPQTRQLDINSFTCLLVALLESNKTNGSNRASVETNSASAQTKEVLGSQNLFQVDQYVESPELREKQLQDIVEELCLFFTQTIPNHLQQVICQAMSTVVEAKAYHLDSWASCFAAVSEVHLHYFQSPIFDSLASIILSLMNAYNHKLDLEESLHNYLRAFKDLKSKGRCKRNLSIVKQIAINYQNYSLDLSRIHSWTSERLESIIKMSLEGQHDDQGLDLLESYFILLGIVLDQQSEAKLAQQENEKLQGVNIKLIEEGLSKWIVLCLRRISFENLFGVRACTTMLSILMKDFNRCESVCSNLASSEQFVTQFLSLLNQIIDLKVLDTSSGNIHRNEALSLFLQLTRKMYLNSYTDTVNKILVQIPFAKVISSVKVLHKQILAPHEKKIEKDELCDLNDVCSSEFCNESKVTPFDQSVVSLLIEVLVILQISALVFSERSFRRSLTPEDYQALNSIQRNSGKSSNQEKLSLYRYVGQFLFRRNDSIYEVHFKIPAICHNALPRLQQQIMLALRSLNQENIHCNLCKLSIYLEKEILRLNKLKKYSFLRILAQREDILRLLALCVLLILLIESVFNTDWNLDGGLGVALITGISILKIFWVVTGIGRVRNRLSTLFNDSSHFRVMTIARQIAESMLILDISYILVAFFMPNTFVKFPALMCMQIILTARNSQTVTRFMIVLVQVAPICALLYLVILSASYNTTDTFIEFVENLKIVIRLFLIGSLPSQSRYQLSGGFLILFDGTYLLLTSVLISSLMLISQKDSERRKWVQTHCLICLRPKADIEAEGVWFKHHIRFQHNIWNYLQFFIYLRRKARGQEKHTHNVSSTAKLDTTEQYLLKQIETGNFSFLKLFK